MADTEIHHHKFSNVFPDFLHIRLQSDVFKPLLKPYHNVENQHRSTTEESMFGQRPVDDFDILSLPTLKPALTANAQLSLTVVYICLYGLLFVMVYVQLWMIWYYRHKRFSYQTCFLFLCLVWSGLRTTLFSFYFDDCVEGNMLPIPLYWLLYCFPVCLQFIYMCLLVLYFAQVVFKGRARYTPSKYKKPLRISLAIVVLVFLLTSVTSAVIVKYHERKWHSVPLELLYARVGINDSLFVGVAIVLSVCIYKMTKMSYSSLVLEAKGTTVRQALVVCVIIILLFTSRALYNLLAVCPPLRLKVPGFGFNWVNVSDQADLVNLSGGYAYLSFGIVLFVWEFLPTFIVVVFFRVKKPKTDETLSDLSSNSQINRSYFFDNPRRYDSEDDLTVSGRNYPEINHSCSVNAGSRNSTPRGTPKGTPRLNYGALHSEVYPVLGVSGTPPVIYSSPRHNPGIVS
ncbi:hypothetical protein ScPMuIL_013874 [Solemya velum]